MTRAAEQGHSGAQFRLAHAYLNGLGVPEEPAWAVHWLGKAAEGGHRDAQAALGAALAGGIGVPEDRVRAWSWLTIAERNGHPGAAALRTRVAAEMTPEDLARAHHLAAVTHARLDRQPAPAGG